MLSGLVIPSLQERRPCLTDVAGPIFRARGRYGIGFSRAPPPIMIGGSQQCRIAAQAPRDRGRLGVATSDCGGKDKAIRITTDAMGETVAIGSGKEPLATAAAALKDLEHILAARARAPVSVQQRSA